MGLMQDIVGAPRGLIGMVHVGALPGTPGSGESVDALAEAAVREAIVLESSGFDAVIVENMHDRPYVHGERLGPEVTASMAWILGRVVGAVRIAVGVQILSGGNPQAIAVAHATGASFIRCEGFVFAHVADEGVLGEAEAGPLLRYRRMIGADRVKVLADVKKKHASHAITGDLTIGQTARAAEFFGADGLVVTGEVTGDPVQPDHLREVGASTGVGVVVGSGVTPANAGSLLDDADGLIVGSWIKHEGVWSNPVDPSRCSEMVEAFRSAAERG